METLEKLNSSKKELERKIEEIEQKRKEEIWEIERLQKLQEAESERKKQLEVFFETVKMNYEVIKNFLGEDVNPKLIWLIIALLETRSPSYAAYGGSILGGEPIINRKHFIEILEKLSEVLDKKK